MSFSLKSLFKVRTAFFLLPGFSVTWIFVLFLFGAGFSFGDAGFALLSILLLSNILSFLWGFFSSVETT
jgi:hypothetical protein